MQAGWRDRAEAHSVKLQGAGAPAETTILLSPKRGSFCAFGNFTRPFLRCLVFPFCSPSLSQQRAAPQPDLPSTGTPFWGVSVLPANPRLASPGAPAMPPGWRTSPGEFSERGCRVPGGGRRGRAALIYDKGFAIKELFSEGMGGGRRTLPSRPCHSPKLTLLGGFCKGSSLPGLRWGPRLKAPARPGPPPPAPSRVSLSRAGGPEAETRLGAAPGGGTPTCPGRGGGRL